ncbi:hypothetical protein FG379_003099 [Cryptosporidium bovis]|uniref:uncharacterized protein n=1 Tax=Cryptosporidium bovis TaxID=310047 RepID=UPI00351A539D|nr:hypothetical protein FG379_003099 [Cryptosporidium bovis]
MEEKKTTLTPEKLHTEAQITIPVVNIKKSEHLETEDQTTTSKIIKLPSIKSMTEAKKISESATADIKHSEATSETSNSSSSSSPSPPSTSGSSPPPQPSPSPSTSGSSPPPQPSPSPSTSGSSPSAPPSSTNSTSLSSSFSPGSKSGSSTSTVDSQQKNSQSSDKNVYTDKVKESNKTVGIKKEGDNYDKYSKFNVYHNTSSTELNLTGGKLNTRRGFESEKYSMIESELDSRFPELGDTFTEKGVPEVKMAFIFTLICLIIVIGFSIRKYRKLKKAGEQVRNVTNTVFPVKIVSLYLYIFLGFPLSVLMQFLSCISPLGFGMYNVVQTIYQGTSYIWLWDLFVEYFGGSEQIVTAIRRTGPYYLWKVPPFMLTTGGETYFQPKTLIVSYILVFQYLFVNVVVGIINVTHPSKAIFFNILHIISLTIAVYGIMLVYWPSKDALLPYQGGWKFGMLLLQSLSIVVIDSVIRLAKYENREYNSIVYKLYWRMMLVCGISTICTLAAVAIVDSREIYKIYNLPPPIKITESSERNNQENKAMLAT